ncbi:hypothetical protein ACIQU6_40870 [Streptomyces sp. NPDC090442]|uniref:hypothetical protein n=1 Tax=Streptomyces sp. NPDC090442 TaxID=3365962 RepID=UPI0037F40C76
MVIATGHDPIQVKPELLVFGRRSVARWYSGHVKDSEEAMAFAVLKDVRPMVESHPLDQAEAVFPNMSQAKYRAAPIPWPSLPPRRTPQSAGTWPSDTSRPLHQSQRQRTPLHPKI